VILSPLRLTRSAEAPESNFSIRASDVAETSWSVNVSVLRAAVGAVLPLGKWTVHGRTGHARTVSVSVTSVVMVGAGATETLLSTRPPLMKGGTAVAGSASNVFVPSVILTKIFASDTVADTRRASAQPNERKSLRMVQSPYSQLLMRRKGDQNPGCS